MRNVKSLLVMALSIVMFGFASCTKENKPAQSIAKTYVGTLSYGVSEMTEVEASVELKAESDDKISIVLPAIGEGMMSISAFTLSGIAVSTTDNKVFAIAETEISQTVGSTNYVGTLSGEVNNGQLTLNYALKPGAMPMNINFTFVGN